ncbi:MAG: RidA family protein [Bacteroidetes bacterium]|nr:RidA family protein [Bacteroidota bacterium]
MIEDKIKELGFELPEPAKPMAAYLPSVQTGNLIFTAGQIPIVNGELKYKGKVGFILTLEEAQKAAQICVLNCLGVIKNIIGSLENIEQIVKLTVFVNSADNFTLQHLVANGASELLGEIFGDRGKHARSAVGVNELPGDSAVEIEMICRVKD